MLVSMSISTILHPVCASDRCTVVRSHTLSLSNIEAVRKLILPVGSHAIVRTIEAQTRNTIIPLDARGLLQACGNIIVDLAEDGDLALDELLLLTSW